MSNIELKNVLDGKRHRVMSVQGVLSVLSKDDVIIKQ